MNTNIREELDIKKSCVYCKSFCSYQNEYEDELEPSDLGRCTNDGNFNQDVSFGYDITCDLFKNK